MIFRYYSSSGLRHQASLFQLRATTYIEFGPMTILASRGEALHATSVGQPLVGRVYPSEAERLFDHMQIRDTIRSQDLRAAGRHPTFFGFLMVRHEPSA